MPDKKWLALTLLFLLTGCVLDPGIIAGPTITVTGPASGDTVVGPVLSITGTTPETAGIEGVYADLDSGGFRKVIGTTAWVTNYHNITAGNHTIRVYAKGSGGLTSLTNTLNVVVTNYTNTNSWTVMIYLDGDNNLELFSLIDFNEMETGLLNAVNSGSRGLLGNMNVIVLIDRGWYGTFYTTDQDGTSWTNTRLYRILPDADATYFGSERLDDGSGAMRHIPDLGEMNMGSSNTLNFLMGYAKTNYPAQNYALVLWDHGAGVQYICVDETSSSNRLYLDIIRRSISNYFNGSSKLNIFGFDACFMGTAEVAFEFRDVAKYMVASMFTEDSFGWAYDTLFGSFHGTDDPKLLSDSVFAKRIVETYRDFHEEHRNNWGDTLSAVDLSKMTALKTGIDALAVQLYGAGNQAAIEAVRDGSMNYYHNQDTASVDVPYYDIYDFCSRIYNDTTNGFSFSLQTAAQNVIDSLASAVVYAYGGTYTNSGLVQSYYYGDGSSVKKGLSLFFSRGNLSYTADTTHVLKSAAGAQSHFWFQWWYTSTNTDGWWSGHYYGNLDFCDSDMDGTVETWRELMKAWYDPQTNTNTPGSY